MLPLCSPGIYTRGMNHTNLSLRLFLVAGLVATTTAAPLLAQTNDWTRFRGPNGTGVADNISMPSDPTAAISWRTQLPGLGHSSPVVWENHLYVQSGDSSANRQTLHCIDALTGKELWKRSIDFKSYRIHNRNSHGSATPTVDETGVYIAWGSIGKNQVSKFSHDGEPVWGKEIGGYQCNHGPAFTLIVVGDLLICPMLEEPPRGGNAEWEIRARILTFDRMNGEPKWTANKQKGKASFCTPCVIGKGDKTEIVFCNTADGMFSLNPADGSENWALPVFKLRTVSSTVIAGDLLVGTNGSGGGGNYLVAVRPGPQPEEVYRVRQQAPYVPTPVFKDGLLFLWGDRGVASCIEASTGKLHWRERIGDSASSSPICVGNEFIGITDSGEVHVIDASKEYRLAKKFSLGATTRSTPAVANGHIYFRTESELIAIKGSQVQN